MPRLIDHAQRERDIAAGAWRVLVRDGLTQLSVRNVAAETGLATASLRRAFPTQDALRLYCIEVLRERVTERIRALSGQGRQLAAAILRELLPLDAERRAEMAVQLQLGGLALTHPQLRATYQSLVADVGRACRLAVAAARSETGEGGGDTPETRTLHALLDGLALHLLWEPEASDGAWAVALLEAQLDEILDHER